MTQTPNALHTSLSGGTESSAEEASMRNQDDRQDTCVRHVGILGALHLLIGLFVGCIVAAPAVMYLGDWAWSLPAALAAVAVAFCPGDEIRSLRA
jgi:hypothetical protein